MTRGSKGTETLIQSRTCHVVPAEKLKEAELQETSSSGWVGGLRIAKGLDTLLCQIKSVSGLKC